MIKIYCDNCEQEVPVETERVMLTARYYTYPSALIAGSKGIKEPQPKEATIFFCKNCAKTQLKMTL